MSITCPALTKCKYVLFWTFSLYYYKKLCRTQAKFYIQIYNDTRSKPVSNESYRICLKTISVFVDEIFKKKKKNFNLKKIVITFSYVQ